MDDDGGGDRSHTENNITTREVSEGNNEKNQHVILMHDVCPIRQKKLFAVTVTNSCHK